jgi:2-keto-4-pentenoate hydratase/2-oxohepta-3-ene-1,7-dioic acid hydratase in catechol pathway
MLRLFHRLQPFLTMRFVTFSKQGTAALAVRHDDTLVDLAAADPALPRSLQEVLTAGPDAYAAIARVLRNAPAASHLDPAAVSCLPPLPNPARIVCLGMNYLDHLDEVDKPMDVPKYPVLFSRFASSLVGHGQALVRPRVSTQLDFEGELVAVIGRAGRHLTPAQALVHVAGYSIFNDASARDMIFDVATAVSLLSECFALQPGDLLITGTPEGIGYARRPQVFMQPGDVCEVEIEGLGTLRNTVREEAAE